MIVTAHTLLMVICIHPSWMFNLSTDTVITDATIHHCRCNFDSNKDKKGLQDDFLAALNAILEADISVSTVDGR
jgi:hypothetical protein